MSLRVLSATIRPVTEVIKVDITPAITTRLVMIPVKDIPACRANSHAAGLAERPRVVVPERHVDLASVALGLVAGALEDPHVCQERPPIPPYRVLLGSSAFTSLPYVADSFNVHIAN